MNLLTFLAALLLAAAPGDAGQAPACPAHDKKPLIGITGGFTASNEGTRCDASAFYGTHRVSSTYIQAVIEAGGVPVILPTLKDSAMVVSVLKKLDGVVFSGGEDIDPSFYGEQTRPDASVSVNAERDTSDLLYARTALKLKMPILGICRGEQLLNVAAGGTLYQDLPTQKGVHHYQEAKASEPFHTIKLVKGGALERIFKTETLEVNSFHHQAVKDLAPGFTVTATAPDGTIEGYEGANVLAVQFHPEGFIAAGDITLLPLFQEFIRRCRY